MYKSYVLNFKKLFIGLLSSMLTGFFSGLLVRNSFQDYDFLIKGAYFPPREIFPVVWAILYLLMGIGFFLILSSQCCNKGSSIYIYILQLFINFLWPILFFVMKAYTFALIWEIILWFAVLAMIIIFFKCSKAAALMQIPYLLWITYAIYLNYTVSVLN